MNNIQNQNKGDSSKNSGDTKKNAQTDGEENSATPKKAMGDEGEEGDESEQTDEDQKAGALNTDEDDASEEESTPSR